MAHLNYLKCLNGVPVSPMEVTLDPAFIPAVVGVTWEPFDTSLMSPKTINAALVGGVVVEDPARKTTYEAGLAKAAARVNAHAAAKLSAVGRPNWGALSVAERKIVVGLVPTDAELGI